MSTETVPWIGSDEVARRLGITRHHVAHLARHGELPHSRVGRALIFEPGDIEKYAAHRAASPPWRGRPRASRA